MLAGRDALRPYSEDLLRDLRHRLAIRRDEQVFDLIAFHDGGQFGGALEMPREASAQFAPFQAICERMQRRAEPDDKDIRARDGSAITIKFSAGLDHIGDDEAGCSALTEVGPDSGQIFHTKPNAETIVRAARITPAQGIEVNEGVRYPRLLKQLGDFRGDGRLANAN